MYFLNNPLRVAFGIFAGFEQRCFRRKGQRDLRRSDYVEFDTELQTLCQFCAFRYYVCAFMRRQNAQNRNA